MPNTARVRDLIERFGGFDRRSHSAYMEDFYGDAGQTLVPPFRGTTTETGGSPSVDYVSASDGVARLLLDSTSEGQTARLDFGDNLLINLSKKPVVEIRAKINFAGTTFSADQRAVFGLASAYNATLDSVTTNVWFRVDGASLNLLWESDDDTTNDDDNDTGVDVVDDTYVTMLIDCYDLSAVKLYADVGGTGDSLEAVGEADISDVSANTRVQVLIAQQRDAGAEAEAVDVDYVYWIQERT